MDDLHDETSELHDEAAHVADELASADGGMLTPLSEARLAEIWQEWQRTGNPALRELLAEVERLCEREAALLAERERLLAVVRAVANQDVAQDIDDPEWLQCLACGGGGPTGESIAHHDICYYVKARAALADAGAGERTKRNVREHDDG